MCIGQDPLIIILKIVKNKNKKLMALETCMQEKDYLIIRYFTLSFKICTLQIKTMFRKKNKASIKL